MKKKKIIIISVFGLLIIATVICTFVSAIRSYQYDMDIANGVDILNGFGAILALLVGGAVVFYELDLFYTVYYFLVKPKTLARSILNILANLSLLLVFFNNCYKDIFSEDVIAPLIVFALYAAFRLSCAVISIRGAIRNCDEF